MSLSLLWMAERDWWKGKITRIRFSQVKHQLIIVLFKCDIGTFHAVYVIQLTQAVELDLTQSIHLRIYCLSSLITVHKFVLVNYKQTIFSKNQAAFHAPEAMSAKKYKSSVWKPLITGAGHELVLDLIVIPELHIHPGITNRLVKELDTTADSVSLAKILSTEKYKQQAKMHQKKKFSQILV